MGQLVIFGAAWTYPLFVGKLDDTQRKASLFELGSCRVQPDPTIARNEYGGSVQVSSVLTFAANGWQDDGKNNYGVVQRVGARVFIFLRR